MMLAALLLSADPFLIERIDTPKEVVAEVGGIDVDAQGRVWACFHHGEVCVLEDNAWRTFATGLHDPLGLLVREDGSVVVMQRPELTELVDLDGDGQADEYNTLCDDFGLSGNYHEFNFGPVEDEDGHLYFALNTASNGAGVRYEKRGAFTLNGRDGRMYASVPWRGWVMKLDPDGTMTPFASGLRSPNGLGFDHEGRLWTIDNQGDWIGTSPLYHLEAGQHYGHPASLVWRDGFSGKPLDRSAAELDAMRQLPAGVFPQGTMANSPCDPIVIPESWGLLAGDLLIGEMNHERICRAMVQEVRGRIRATITTMIDGGGLRMGNNRLAFAEDGTLWVGHTDHGWTGAKGITKITPTGQPFLAFTACDLTADGFALSTTRPLTDEELAKANVSVRRFRYNYHVTYGSDQYEQAMVAATLQRDGDGLRLRLSEMEPWFVYELRFEGLPLVGDVLVAQVHEPVEGPVPPRPMPYTPSERRQAEAARKAFLSR